MDEVTLEWMNAHNRGDEGNRKVRQIRACFDFLIVRKSILNIGFNVSKLYIITSLMFKFLFFHNN
jgi:hypothetical protein